MGPIGRGSRKKRTKIGPSVQLWVLVGLAQGRGSQLKLTGGQELLGLGWGVIYTTPCLYCKLRAKSSPPQLICLLTRHLRPRDLQRLMGTNFLKSDLSPSTASSRVHLLYFVVCVLQG